MTQSHHPHPNTALCNPWHAACSRLAPDTPGDFRGSETGLLLSKLCLPSAVLIRQLPADTLTVQGRVGGSG